MNAPAYIPPADYIPVPTTHPLETGKWLTPGGWYHVELVDQSQATWERYCAEIVAEARRQARTHRQRETDFRAAFARAQWGDA